MYTSLLDSLRTELAARKPMDAAAAALIERGPAFLTSSRARHGDVQMHVLDALHHAFDAFELLVILCGEIADEYESDWRTAVSDPTNDAITMAVRGMFWSGQVVAGEVLALLRAGYSAGALARWRALHEVATQAEFITALRGALAGQTARKYLDHENYRSCAEAKAMQGFLGRFAPERRFSKADMHAVDAVAAAAVEKHGREFRGDYGWAHTALAKISAAYREQVELDKKPRGPSFTDVAAIVHAEAEERQFWRMLTNDANSAAHGATRSIRASGTPGDVPRLMRGPDLEAVMLSSVGFASPRRLTALLAALTHPYPVEEDEDDEDELERVHLLETVVILGVLVERAFVPMVDRKA